MEGDSLRSRAFAFALCVGVGTFILAMVAGSGGAFDAGTAANALIVAIICGAMSWASASQTLSSMATAVDAAIKRLIDAAHGDFEAPTPEAVRKSMPELAKTMDALFVETRSTLESIHNLAMFDPVTGLPNRTHFRRDVERTLCDVPDGQCGALLFVDLDNFKVVNDTLGHAHGDQLLVRVANRLRSVLQAERTAGRGSAEQGVIGRLAGDEFTMFLPCVEDSADALGVGQHILSALNEDIDLSGHAIHVGASIGVALYPAHGRSLTMLMKAADVAMYHAKACGRGQAQLYNDALTETLSEKLKLERDLRIAIERNQFALVFQPQLDLNPAAPASAEALLRWNHPDVGLRFPGAFIDTAEDSNLIVLIGDWVIDTVAATIARWDALGIQQRVAINISPRQMDQRDFFSRLQAKLDYHGAPAHLLELEISEGVAMTCGEAACNALAALRREGALISIDDFGTGYSNLARLRDMPIDRVKLDRSLIADITTSEQARAVAQAVVSLIHGLGHQVVAEGVETEDQVEVLKIIGCDSLQGYAIATPMDELRFIDWSKRGRSALAVA